jgi:hypothetical protein
MSFLKQVTEGSPYEGWDDSQSFKHVFLQEVCSPRLPCSRQLLTLCKLRDQRENECFAVYPPSPPPKRASLSVTADAPLLTKRSSTEAGFAELAASQEVARKAARSTSVVPFLEHNSLHPGAVKPAANDTAAKASGTGWRFPNSSATQPKRVFRKRFTGRAVSTSGCRFGRFDTPAVEPTAEQAAEVLQLLLMTHILMLHLQEERRALIRREEINKQKELDAARMKERLLADKRRQLL